MFVPRDTGPGEKMAPTEANQSHSPSRPTHHVASAHTSQSPCGTAHTLEGRTAVSAAVYGTSSDLSMLSTCPMISSEG